MLYVSPASEGVLGYSPDSLVGQPMLSYVHPEDADDAGAKWALQESTQELRLIHADGSLRTVEAIANNLLGDPAVAGVVIAFRDITDRQRLERQLVQAQKMEAIGTLAGGVAHDFNNLLTVITGYSQLILESSSDPETRAQVRYIREAGDHAATLTHQLLAFSRRQVLQPRVFDLNGLIARVEGMLRRLIGEDIEVVTVSASGLGMVRADPSQMEQVIMNLAVNARDAMPKGGILTIETANVELDREYIQQHPELVPGSYVMLAVSDTGTGMAPEVLAHLFEPFFTTKEVGRGTGLGLSMVYGIIKQSGGHVSVYTEVGRGSTFKVYLPRVDKKIVTTEIPRLGIPAKAYGSETILLVEDQPQLRELTRAVLQRAGYSVIVAETAPEALTLCQQSPTPIHLMLSDVVMPRLSGRELADQALRHRPEMKVLFMSGYAPNAVVQHGVLESGTFFLEKPFTPPALLQKLREVLDSGKGQPRI
jgi:PAS domain S-box-containing protein